jgi:hypothetical protein
MKIENLHIERRPSYDDDYPNMLAGIVQIAGEQGKMEVRLSNKVVSQIFTLIKEDVQRTADYNSSQVGQAIEQAENEAPLIENMAGKP